MDLAQKPVYKLDLAAGTSVVNLTTPLVEGDDRAQTFTLELTDKGVPANLDGYSVTAYFGRGKTAEAEADTIPLSGTVSGNVATITLTESCYSRSCYFSMPIRMSNGATGQKRTYLIVRGTVVKSVDGTIIDPDGSVPSLDDLFAQIAVMERSRQAAEEATEEALAAAARADEAREAIQDDLAALSEDIARNTAPPIIPTATGSIVTITDGAARPAVELISHIEPVQEGSGEASPNNVRPISGWDTVTAQGTGANLLDSSALALAFCKVENGIYISNFEDGYYCQADTVALNEFLMQSKGKKLTFAIDAGIADSFLSVVVYGNRNNVPSLEEFNSGNGAKYLTFTLNDDFTSVVKLELRWNRRNTQRTDLTTRVAYLQLVCGDNVAYEPYQGQPLTTSLPETVYGGKKNWTTGKAFSEWAVATLTGNENVFAGNVGDTIRFDIYGVLPGFFGATSNERLNILCSHYHTNAAPISTNNMNFAIGSYGTDPNVYLRDDRFATADAYKAYLAAQYAAGTPVQIAYKLATPKEIQLTPQQLDTLKGTNNVWSSTGDTTLSYIADTKSYIDQKLAAIAAATL